MAFFNRYGDAMWADLLRFRYGHPLLFFWAVIMPYSALRLQFGGRTLEVWVEGLWKIGSCKMCVVVEVTVKALVFENLNGLGTNLLRIYFLLSLPNSCLRMLQ
jgi:hypothetical protein